MLLETMFSDPLRVIRDTDRRQHAVRSHRRSATTGPALNVWSEEDALIVEAELPGLTDDQLELLATAEELMIRGARDVSLPDDVTWIHRERATGTFERTLSLPVSVEPDRIDATLQHGVLRVSLPFAAESRPRRIEIQHIDASRTA